MVNDLNDLATILRFLTFIYLLCGTLIATSLGMVGVVRGSGREFWNRLFQIVILWPVTRLD